MVPIFTIRKNSIVAIVPTAILTLLVLSACALGSEETDIPSEATYSGSEGVRLITTSAPNVVPEGDPREPWLGEQAWIDAVQTGQTYIDDFPEPQNVQVLQGMTTAEIWIYMQQHVSGALGVSCQYCHDINNYAADPYPEKISARLMLLLVNDINSQFLSQTPGWGGRYATCATCHNMQPQGMLAFSTQNNFVPEDEAGRDIPTWKIDTYAIAEDYQSVHNNIKTGKMLAMVDWMEDNWSSYVLPRREPITEIDRSDRLNYVVFGEEGNETIYAAPNCYTCHSGVNIPTSAVSKFEMTRLPDNGYTVMPPQVRGLTEEELQEFEAEREEQRLEVNGVSAEN